MKLPENKSGLILKNTKISAIMCLNLLVLVDQAYHITKILFTLMLISYKNTLMFYQIIIWEDIQITLIMLGSLSNRLKRILKIV